MYFLYRRAVVHFGTTTVATVFIGSKRHAATMVSRIVSSSARGASARRTLPARSCHMVLYKIRCGLPGGATWLNITARDCCAAVILCRWTVELFKVHPAIWSRLARDVFCLPLDGGSVGLSSHFSLTPFTSNPYCMPSRAMLSRVPLSGSLQARCPFVNCRNIASMLFILAITFAVSSLQR